MTVPAIPFYMSAAGTEAGISGAFFADDSRIVSLVGHAVPFYFSELAGKSSLSVSLSRTSAIGSRSTAGVATTSAVTATASGGNGTYTYSWVKISGDAINAGSPASATTTFSGTVSSAQSSLQATFECNVTSAGKTVSSAALTVTLTYLGSGA